MMRFRVTILNLPKVPLVIETEALRFSEYARAILPIRTEWYKQPIK